MLLCSRALYRKLLFRPAVQPTCTIVPVRSCRLDCERNRSGVIVLDAIVSIAVCAVSAPCRARPLHRTVVLCTSHESYRRTTVRCNCVANQPRVPRTCFTETTTVTTTELSLPPWLWP